MYVPIHPVQFSDSRTSLLTPGGEPTKVEWNYIWANVITFAQM